MQWTEGIPAQEWDSALSLAGGHFLQTSHWAAFQHALGKRVFYAYGASWQCLAILEESRTGRRLYCPYGPLAKNQTSLKEALEALKTLARQERAVFVRVEPLITSTPERLQALGLKPALKDIQPRQTWVQDLTKSEEALLSDMTATNRNLWRNHTKKGLKLRVSNKYSEMRIFIDMMREVAGRNHIVQHSDIYYRTMAKVLTDRGAAKLYIAELDGKPVASAFCFDSPTTRYYAHAAAKFAARNVHPGTALLAEMILDAQVEGKQQFDFVGIAPTDAPDTHPWKGLTKFKQSFGGEYKAYNGTWELPASPLRYGVYRAAYVAKNAIRKLV